MYLLETSGEVNEIYPKILLRLYLYKKIGRYLWREKKIKKKIKSEMLDRMTFFFYHIYNPNTTLKERDTEIEKKNIQK